LRAAASAFIRPRFAEEGSAAAMVDYAAARLNMVEGQIRPNKVTDEAILAGFLELPRERFVPPALKGAAYVDEDLPLGHGRHLMEPMVLARLLQLAAIGPEDTVLEIGCGTGYATALLSRLARAVVAVEEVPALVETARQRLQELRCDNATVIDAPLVEGYAGRAPYDVIFINGAVAAVPEAIVKQLGGGGRLVTVVREGGGMGMAMLMMRVAGGLSRFPEFEAGTPLLPGFAAQPGFVF
jgi:protein-L-isoaspartate(D-aspartate) O-methyltransferase